MANQVYNNFKKLALSGTVNFNTATLKMMLFSGNYTFSQSHTVTGDLGLTEIKGGSYTPGGQTLSSVTISIDTVDNEVVLDAADMTYSAITAALRYGIIYVAGGTLSTSYLIGQVDFGAQTLAASDFQVTWNAEGILNLM